MSETKINPSLGYSAELLDFLRGKLADAEKALRCRKEGEATWRGGTNDSWRAVGCRLTKAQRLKIADAESRITVRCQREVDMFRAVIAALGKQSSRSAPMY